MRPKSVVNLTTCPSPSSVLERILMQHEGACCYTQTRLMGLPARTAEKRLGVEGSIDWHIWQFHGASGYSYLYKTGVGAALQSTG